MTAPSRFFERIRLQGEPVADPASVVVRAQARFTALTARLLRLEWSANGIFEDRSTFAFPNRAAPPPSYSVTDSSSALTIDTGSLQLRYQLDSGPFSSTNLAITLDLNGAPVTWRPGLSGDGNLRGPRRTLD